MNLGTTLTGCFGVTFASMFVLWLVSLRRRDASIVDPFWGTGFILVAFTACVLNWPVTPRVLIMVALTSIWGLRLSAYLLVRNLRHGEDRRYRAMRDYHGERFWWVSLLTVFLLQGAILWFVSLPIQLSALVGSIMPLGLLDFCGVAIFGIGLFFEAIGDWQMAKFQADRQNAGRVMDRGLWRYTRHPNYFGDFCVWWGLYLIAAAGGAVGTILSPLLMSFLLLRVSGVTLLEKTITGRRPDYVEYQFRTNAFFPGPSKSKVDP